MPDELIRRVDARKVLSEAGWDYLASEHPLLLGLLMSLPSTTDYWAPKRRERWLEAAKNVIAVVYEDEWERTAVWYEIERRDQVNVRLSKAVRVPKKRVKELAESNAELVSIDETVGPRIELDNENAELEKRVAELERYDIRTIVDFHCRKCGTDLPSEPEEIKNFILWCNEHAELAGLLKEGEDDAPLEDASPPDAPAEPESVPDDGAAAKPKAGRGPKWCSECQAVVSTKKHRQHKARLLEAEQVAAREPHTHHWKLGPIDENGETEGTCTGCPETRTFDAHGKPMRAEPSA